MLTIRYFVLLLAYHFRSFFHMMPWSFVWGLLPWPVHLVKMMSLRPEYHKPCVVAGTSVLLAYAEAGTLPPMGPCLKKRFENLRKEALS